MEQEPRTLQEALISFSDPVNCREYLVARRWPNGVTCPRCGSANVLFLEKYSRWHCREKHAAPQFTLKTGTIMEDSPIGLDKWLTAMWQIVNSKNGVSSWEIHRALGITQKTAWFMHHRIRLALGMAPSGKFSGEVEADETFIGGKARNMHLAKRKLRITGTGPKDKVAVMQLLERGGEVRTTVTPHRKKKGIQPEVRTHVEAATALHSDALNFYAGLEAEYAHQVIDHDVAYLDGRIPTNALENFWSLLERSIRGTYVSVEPYHLFRYLHEQAFRYNTRKIAAAERLGTTVRQIAGKRLTYGALTSNPQGETID